jgi:hypothetical protein
MTPKTLSRRSALGTLAGLGASRLVPVSPFVPVSARAADVGPPKRLLLVFHPMGYLEQSFWPTRTPDGDFSLGETQTALADWKNKLIYLDGLIMYGASWYFPDDDNEHGSGAATCFTGSKKQGFATGPSIDQPIADHIMKNNPGLPYRALNLGVRAPSPSGHTNVFVQDGKKPVIGDNNPKAVFDRLFKNFTPGMPVVDTAGLERLRAQKQSVIDLVRGDLDRVCARIGAQEKDRCDAHLDAVRAIEKRLDGRVAAGTPAACTKPTLGSTGELVAHIRAQMDLVAAAFTCDLTRVATLQLGHCDGGLSFLGLNQHDVTHKTGDTKGGAEWVTRHKMMDRWFAGHWAYLFKKLDSIKDSQGTLLDNTLVLFGSDTTTSSSYSWGAHAHWRFPYWLAGGGNFAFKTGRYLKFDHPTRGDRNVSDAKMWQAHNRLLVSVARAFGLGVDTFGNLDPGTGPLPQL